ncbi:hypothetical protein BCR44DRAFT_335315 [Catenaria anguillulae PL171]|uniref:Uncharacterized protein n=1 Tax=Catenaria anguillulae PL171 TaxID=765915 RepID=A0A1Y2HM29_9FUNG|nr:hypothetical protein BCR44DRAFT_335315 [Catenaria anguillulae PL171]
MNTSRNRPPSAPGRPTPGHGPLRRALPPAASNADHAEAAASALALPPNHVQWSAAVRRFHKIELDHARKRTSDAVRFSAHHHLNHLKGTGTDTRNYGGCGHCVQVRRSQSATAQKQQQQHSKPALSRRPSSAPVSSPPTKTHASETIAHHHSLHAAKAQIRERQRQLVRLRKWHQDMNEHMDGFELRQRWRDEQALDAVLQESVRKQNEAERELRKMVKAKEREEEEVRRKRQQAKEYFIQDQIKMLEEEMERMRVEEEVARKAQLEVRIVHFHLFLLERHAPSLLLHLHPFSCNVASAASAGNKFTRTLPRFANSW